jgi:3-methyladenine DNA glycosylase AlkD
MGYADTVLDETEFFIRKAVGWVLREVSKKRDGTTLASGSLSAVGIEKPISEARRNCFEVLP